MIDPQIKLLAQTAFLALQDIKAKDLKGLDLEPIQSYADFVFVASGTNTRQTQTLADNVQKKVFEVCKRHPLGTEGYQFGQWILVDYGDVICHIFLDETRQLYKLEDMWSEITPMNESDLEFYFTGKRAEKTQAPVKTIKKSSKPKPATKKPTPKKPAAKPTKKKTAPKKAPAKKKKSIKVIKKTAKVAVKKTAKKKPTAKKAKKTVVKKSSTKKSAKKKK